MAAKAVSCSINSGSIRQIGSIDSPIRTVSSAAVEAAVVALEGDPADQGSAVHVATLRTQWNLLVSGLGAVPARSDCLLSWDTSAVVTRSKLREATRALTDAAMGLDGLSGS